MKTAIIVGCQGQDGKLLNDLLIKKGYKVFGIARNRTVDGDGSPLKPVDIKNTGEVFGLVERLRPDEIYYLAAFHHSSQAPAADDVDLYQQSFDIQVLALVNFLEGIRRCSSCTRLFYAASSHIFGDSEGRMQDEETMIKPNDVYGLSKAAGLGACRLHRSRYAVFASAGILYNHESPLRGEEFISKKIITAAVNIKRQKQKELVLGDLDAEIDWGWAPDYVEAMHRINNAPQADDFIVATGKKHQVRDFVQIAFACLDLDWRRYVRQEPSIITKKNYCRIGNPRKLMDTTGWRPSVDFREMIKLLVAGQLK